MVDDGDGRLFEVAEAEPVEKAAAGAAKKFRVYDQGQSFLLPPSLDDWLPEATRRGLCPRPSIMLDLTAIYAPAVTSSIDSDPRS